MFHKGQKSEKITGRRGAYSLCVSVGTERVEGEKLSPEEIIGSANIQKLLLAGYKIIPSDRGRFTCPRCDYFESNIRPSEALAMHREELRQLLAEHNMGNPRVFGSVLHGDDTTKSDLDLLVDYPEDATFTADLRSTPSYLSPAVPCAPLMPTWSVHSSYGRGRRRPAPGAVLRARWPLPTAHCTRWRPRRPGCSSRWRRAAHRSPTARRPRP